MDPAAAEQQAAAMAADVIAVRTKEIADHYQVRCTTTSLVLSITYSIAYISYTACIHCMHTYAYRC
jgi:hypothetical protein